ncbi:PREDICTED: uncharacterized protein LOC109362069 [Lupinus angustifolius]|uniref:uncharacterized protein LOC109362069 n=1 Tax=Lupinus angustifolius TaxID=3871 RepID=UPI00092E7D3B|nr:PREDICTED: uncharacterized protein LOC109362069 [Lupinus angustifolius]
MYEAISSAIAKWLTPSSLFIFLNLVIVTIFIISRFIAPKTQILRVPSLLERVKSFDFNLYKYQQPHPQTEHVQTEPEHRTQDLDSNLTNLQEPQLTRAPSFLQRLQSIKVSRLYKSESIHGEKESEPETVEQWMPATARREKTRLREEEEGVDAKADDFIKRFKKQLRLQRVDSFLRYRDMLE